ncbi:MAG: hypothetical protein ACOX80_04650 [Methanomassiliicoccaceae archaeon]|jgi:hypothetical protein|nr:hypothetical protein [Euryarchaeota archaeon]HOB37931.1 hypothetical protein [Methanomassiliicoccaceae archaeon]HOL07032.1 hypothetical protein [Methanomassiliicoccaceae archaeon]HQA21107.1 hypothetical protein [Methanomassiliicoccaceae archaeon]HQD87643.1 hypothetical protein [Methanomassiliicoccaceae archaeon]
MGISIAICELDSDESLCKKGKLTILKARLDDVSGYEAIADYDEVVPTAEARRLLGGEWEAFLKRNRIDGEGESFLLSKVKNEADSARLKDVARKEYSGWIDLSQLPPEEAEAVMKKAGEDNLMSEWNTIPLDETNEICARCVMSWDKGRGCIGNFGPENSQLPDIAKKYDCEIVASVPELAKSGKKLSPEEARRLSEECKVLREKLPEEGKGPARRYGGVVDRLETVADLCAAKGVRIYFL